MASRYHTREGIVIRRTGLPSGDVVATLLGAAGKWRGIARKGKLPGGNIGRLSLFHDVTAQVYLRNGDDLAVFTQVRLNGALSGLSRPEIYPLASLLAELAERLSTAEDTGGRLYPYFASGLRGLVRHPDPEAVGLVYAWRLLRQAGLAPRTGSCARCSRPDPSASFDPAAGGMTCDACAGGIPLDPDAAAEVRRVLGAEVREALEPRPERRSLHWRLLHLYTDFHVDRLNSFGAVLTHPGRVATPGV